MSQQNVNNDYYNIHCVECGEIFKSNKLTFNIDELLKKHSDYIKREKGNNSDYDVFKSIKLGMNYPKEEVQALLGRKKIETKDIRDFLKNKYDIEVEVKVEEHKEPEEAIPQPRGRRRLETHSNTTSIPAETLEKYRKNIKFRARDIDSTTKEVCYEQLHKILSKDEVILEIEDFQILEKKDDRGNLFPDKIRYSFPDGSRYVIDELSCPNCGADIIGNLGEHEQFVIGMIGSARVGKTAYLAALVDRLNPEMGAGDIIDENIFVRIGDSGIGRKVFEDSILKPYRANQPIPKTPPVNGWVPVFCLEITINETPYIFTFVDMPGEIFCRDEDEDSYVYQDEEFIMNTHRIITNSHMLWFCVDPSQIDPIIQKRERENGQAENADKVVWDINRLIESVENKLRIISDDRQNAAILITKSDKIDSSFELTERRGPEERLTKEENKKSIFLAERHDEHTRRVYHYLQDRNPRLIRSFEHMFEDFNLFAIAAYGINVPNESNIGRKPSNVEQPFLWTCAILDILSAEKTITRTEERKVKKGLFSSEIVTETITETKKIGKEQLFFNK